jgi:putative addiction module killer protein
VADIVKFCTSDGSCPFDNWFLSLDKINRARIAQRLARLRLGNFGDAKPVTYKKVNGIFELRLFFGAGYRVYFASIEHELVLLLCAGSKDTQDRDIAKAAEYWTAYKQEKLS